MFKWKVVIYLKNGNIFKGVYETEASNSFEAAKELFPEDKPNCISFIKSEREDKALFFKIQEVAAFEMGV